jgi:hypothetical protein
MRRDGYVCSSGRGFIGVHLWFLLPFAFTIIFLERDFIETKTEWHTQRIIYLHT